MYCCLFSVFFFFFLCFLFFVVFFFTVAFEVKGHQSLFSPIESHLVFKVWVWVLCSQAQASVTPPPTLFPCQV